MGAAEQWQSTTDHAPPPVDSGGWQSTAEHATQPEKPGIVSRFIAGTGVPDMYRAITKDRPAGEEPLNPMAPGVDQTIRNAWDMVKGMAEASGAHLEAANHFANKGDYVSAIGHTLYATPGIGELGYQTANKFIEGDIAGGLGGLTALFVPKLAAKVPAVAGQVADSAMGTAIGGAVKGAAKGAVEMVPTGTGVRVPAVVAGAATGGLADLGLTHILPHELAPVAPVVGALAPMVRGAVSGARQALADRSAAQTAAARSAIPLTPLQKSVIAGREAILSEPLPEAVPQVSLGEAMVDPAQVMAERLAARQRPQPAAAPPPRPEPAWTQGPGPGPDPRTFSTEQMNAEMSPEQFQQALAERAGAMRNRNVTGVLDRLKAMSQEQSVAPSTPTPQPAIAPAVSPVEASGAGATTEPVTLGDALKDPITAKRNALREAKVAKVIDHLKAKEFDAGSVQLISPRQWSAVAQSAGVNDLTPAQIDLIKKQFPKE